MGLSHRYIPLHDRSSGSDCVTRFLHPCHSPVTKPCLRPSLWRSRPFMRATRILLLSLCAALSACAAKKPPPPQSASLGESKLEYRDYSRVKGSLCGMDPRRLGPEMQKINEALEQF